MLLSNSAYWKEASAPLKAKRPLQSGRTKVTPKRFLGKFSHTIMRISLPTRNHFPGLALCALLTMAAPSNAQTPLPAAGKAAKPVTVSVSQYRAQRVKARDDLAKLAARTGGGARNATVIFKALDKAQIVKRADGQTQSANGNRWSALTAGVSPLGAGDGYNIKALQREEIKQLQRDLDAEIAEVDAWNTRTNGAYYQPVDAGAIMRDLEKTGQIRTGPTWLQLQWQNLKKWAIGGIKKFFKWLGSLFPTFAPRVGSGALPDFSWLIFVFWALIASLLAFLLFAAYRAFAGNVRWGGRRRKKNEEQLEGEDAELLLLPPDELIGRAAQFASEGNFREALRHRYIALLLRLDGRGVWRYDTRRTNWEHIAALRRGDAQSVGANAKIVAPLSDLTRRFDRVRYGGAPCDGAHWQQFDADAQSLESNTATTQARELTGASR